MLQGLEYACEQCSAVSLTCYIIFSEINIYIYQRVLQVKLNPEKQGLLKHGDTGSNLLINEQRLCFRDPQLGEACLHVRLEAVRQPAQALVQILSILQAPFQLSLYIHLTWNTKKGADCRLMAID